MVCQKKSQGKSQKMSQRNGPNKPKKRSTISNLVIPESDQNQLDWYQSVHDIVSKYGVHDSCKQEDIQVTSTRSTCTYIAGDVFALNRKTLELYVDRFGGNIQNGVQKICFPNGQTIVRGRVSYGSRRYEFFHDPEPLCSVPIVHPVKVQEVVAAPIVHRVMVDIPPHQEPPHMRHHRRQRVDSNCRTLSPESIFKSRMCGYI